MSLTSVRSKLPEDILRDNNYMHLERQVQIRDSQHDFMHEKRYLEFELFEKVTKKIDNAVWLTSTGSLERLLMRCCMVCPPGRLDHRGRVSQLETKFA